jgi:calcineurin-like phosphoesterase family protein
VTIFFTSDTHFSHVNMCGAGDNYCNRPWDSTEEMNEALIENWNNTVTVRDKVYVLGDVCMGLIDDSLALLPRLNGTKVLIPGNHDRCWIGNGPKSVKWIQRYVDVGFVPTSQRKFVTGKNVWLMDHFPYQGDHTKKDRYSEYRPKDEGLWLLHGHVHDEWDVRPAERMINVGTDVWNYRPVAIETLEELKEAVA